MVVPDKYKCPICFRVLQTPVETSCGHCFCQQCLSTWLSTRNVCPMDREPLTMAQVHVSRRLEREINNLGLSSGPRPFSRDSDRSVHINVCCETGLPTRCSDPHSQHRHFPCRCVLVVIIVILLIIAAVVVAVLMEFVFKDKESKVTTLNNTCSPDLDTCTNGLTCDITRQICLLQADEYCGDGHEDLCLRGSFCHSISKRCLCEWGLHQQQGMCVLKLGDSCAGRLEDLCWKPRESYCNLDTTGTCTCYQQYVPDGDVCRLKAEIPSVQCSQATACVKNASCESHTDQCLCDQDFSIKRDGTCGMQVSVKQGHMTCASSPPCVDNATCSDTLQSCVCDHHFASLASGSCGLKVKVTNVDCRTVTNCVDNARCDSVTNQCVCEDDFSPRQDGTCGLKVSVSLESRPCSNFPPCVDNATCSEAKHRCGCSNNFVELSDGTCGLKAEVAGADCRQVASCVPNAVCDTSNGRCRCETAFSARRDGTCGLKASVRRVNVSCSDFPHCVDNAHCSDLQHACLCEYNFAQLLDGTCALKARVSSVDCRVVTQCVVNATCRDVGAGHQCVCNSGSPADDTCGLRVSTAGPDCKATGCPSSSSCDYDWATGKYTCEDNCYWRWFKLKCCGDFAVPSLAVTALATFLSIMLNTLL